MFLRSHSRALHTDKNHYRHRRRSSLVLVMVTPLCNKIIIYIFCVFSGNIQCDNDSMKMLAGKNLEKKKMINKSIWRMLIGLLL